MRGIGGDGSSFPLESEVARLQGVWVSGARRIRTADLLGAIQALCQLSYSPEMADLQGIMVCETADATGIL
jgi:hypothetical protein